MEKKDNSGSAEDNQAENISPKEVSPGNWEDFIDKEEDKKDEAKEYREQMAAFLGDENLKEEAGPLLEKVDGAFSFGEKGGTENTERGREAKENKGQEQKPEQAEKKDQGSEIKDQVEKLRLEFGVKLTGAMKEIKKLSEEIIGKMERANIGGSGVDNKAAREQADAIYGQALANVRSEVIQGAEGVKGKIDRRAKVDDVPVRQEANGAREEGQREEAPLEKSETRPEERERGQARPQERTKDEPDWRTMTEYDVPGYGGKNWYNAKGKIEDWQTRREIKKSQKEGTKEERFQDKWNARLAEREQEQQKLEARVEKSKSKLEAKRFRTVEPAKRRYERLRDELALRNQEEFSVLRPLKGISNAIVKRQLEKGGRVGELFGLESIPRSREKLRKAETKLRPKEIKHRRLEGELSILEGKIKSIEQAIDGSEKRISSIENRLREIMDGTKGQGKRAREQRQEETFQQTRTETKRGSKGVEQVKSKKRAEEPDEEPGYEQNEGKEEEFLREIERLTRQGVSYVSEGALEKEIEKINKKYDSNNKTLKGTPLAESFIVKVGNRNVNLGLKEKDGNFRISIDKTKSSKKKVKENVK